MTAVLFDEETQTRAAELVDITPDQGILTARLMQYEREAVIGDGVAEVFTRGAFSAAVSNPRRVKVTQQQHDRSIVVGHATSLEDRDDGLYGTLQIADTSAGRDLLTLLRGAYLDELSVEFRPNRAAMKVTRRGEGDLLVRHNKATLVGISPVSAGAYADGSRVLSVRAAAIDKAREEALARLHALTSGADRVKSGP